jgi:hypothetical protein
MKKFLLPFLMTVVATGLLFTGCNKDDDKKNSELIVGSWKLTAMTVSPALPFVGSDVYGFLDACDKDDVLIFETGGVVKSDEGATKCDTSDPQTTTDSYAFNPDQTILTYTDKYGDSYSVTVVELSGSKFVGTYVEDDSGVAYTYTLTFTKQ